MSMEEVLDSLRRIITRWTVTETLLLSDTNIGDTILTVDNTKRFIAGDEIMIKNSTKGELGLIVSSIIDETHLSVTTPVKFQWYTSELASIRKTFYKNSIQSVYLGDPENIPKFPAVTINANSLDLEPFTLDSWKQTYNIDITVYVQSSNQEDTYRFLMKTTESIRQGLRDNFFPLVGPYNSTYITQNIVSGDTFIKVTDSSIFSNGVRVLIEDIYKSEEHTIKSIPDSTTIETFIPICHNFDITNNLIAIQPSRFFYSSYPTNTQFGTIFKGTLLKASKITWQAYEEVLGSDSKFDTSLS